MAVSSSAVFDSRATGSWVSLHVFVADGKSLAVNPNSGLAGVMDCLRTAIKETGVLDKDHLELCDEYGKLVNPSDFPPLMMLSSFLRPTVTDAFFVPFRVERDAGKQILRVEPLLNDVEKNEPEMMQRLRKENRIPRERKGGNFAQKDDGLGTRQNGQEGEPLARGASAAKRNVGKVVASKSGQR
ncbi:hypothetical protein RvY_02984 [Ramazzottius varieornatus]|uniref:Uncharacterized protein n=1 Tax=Ramazzottius varieornatus TaxID=947166 RepID=A0A1D1UQB2_RAMVA|nr:hypothetical protein RvY_02984 [Ramazzottius varieornatus]